MKQGRTGTTDDGMNDDAVLVDEPHLLERSRELGRSDEDPPLGLRFQRRDRLAKVTLHLDRVLPRKVAPRGRLRDPICVSGRRIAWSIARDGVWFLRAVRSI